MAFRVDGTNDYARLAEDATSLGSSVNSTVLVWYRKEDSTDGRIAAYLKFGSTQAYWQVSPTAGNLRVVASGGLATDYALASNTYAALAISRTGRYVSFYAWTEAGVRTDVALSFDTNNYASQTKTVAFGRPDAYLSAALGSYRYARFWSRALSAAELDDEIVITPSSGTPAASSTNLLISTALADATTATNWANGGTPVLTLSGGATSSDEPNIPGGSSMPTTGSDAGSRRNRPGRGPYSRGRYFRASNWLDAFVIGAQSYDVSVLESVVSADSVSALGQFGVALSESGSAADALSTVATFLRAVAETAAAADSASSAATLPASLTEAGSASDALSTLGAFGAAISESGSASDAVTTGSASYSVAIAEAASAADAISNVLTAGAALAETATASDAVSSLALLVASLAEAGSASDVYSTTGAIYSVNFTEAATALDAIAAQLERLGVLVEAGAAADGVSTLVQFGAAVVEAVAALDAVAATGISGVEITEAGSATDLVSAPSGFGETPAGRVIHVRYGSRVIAVR